MQPITPNQKPVYLSVVPENIPQELKNQPGWVIWRAQNRDGKWTKPPYDAKTSKNFAKVNDQNTWSDFETAYTSYLKNKMDGIGLMIQNGHFGVDVDYPVANPVCTEILNQFKNTYLEKSPSGGLHIWGCGQPLRCGKGKNDSNIEIYNLSSPRYLTVTGHPINKNPLTNCQKQLKWLHDNFFVHKPTGEGGVGQLPLTEDIKGILEKAFESKNGDKTRRLFAGDWMSDYQTQNSADMAFCDSLAFWFAKDPSLMDQAFRMSGLMRAKWDEKRKSTTYGKALIDKACAEVTSCYRGKNNGGSKRPPAPAPVSDPIKDAQARGILPKDDKLSELPFCFWKEVINLRNGVPELKILYDDLYNILEKQGIRKLINDEKEKLLVQIENNIIQQIDVSDIRNSIFNMIDQLPDQISPFFLKKDLKENLRKGLNVYVEDAKLDTLPFTEIKFLRDEKDKSLFFFRNGIIEVTKNDIVLKSYSELKTPIWKSQIIDFDVEIIKETNIKKFEESDFLKFCQNVCTKRCETGNFVDQKRFDSLMTVLGYLCNNYKDLAYPKAVIFSDASLENKPEGGSGKGILAQAVGQLRKMAVINGKKFDWDNRFNLSKVTRDTHFVYFDDVGKNFDMEKGFSLMSEGYEIERKNKDSFRLGYKESPKTGMSTNYSMKGEGSSHRRRKQEFELYNYYNDKFTPDMDFGRLFFSEQWDFNQWNLFYNFMFQCVQSFFDNNCRMKECVSETLEMKKLRNEVGINFIEFMGKLDHNTWLQLDEIYEEFAQDFLSEKEGEWYSKKKFAMSLQKYCDYYQLDLKSDRRTVGSAKRTFYFIKKDFQK